MEMNSSAFSAQSYVCDICTTVCMKKNDWTRHLQTNKHLRKSGVTIEPKKTAIDLTCKCGKQYNTKSGLWKHAKKCQYKPTKIQYLKHEPINNDPINNDPINNGPINESILKGPNVNDISFLTNLVLEVVKNNNEVHQKYADLQKQNTDLQKQNNEFQKEMLKLCKTGITTNSHNSYNHSHNKTFNLQFFLNEQCKDAMNIMDFVDSMTLEFSDLEDVGKLGYVEGISNIIIRKLNEMDIYKRPIHCSDGKREIMYVKDDNVWEKENSTYDKLRKAIKYITKKNGDLMIPWSKEHPMCMNTSHPLNDTYIQIMSQSMGGKESFVESENKIMKKIAKAVLIEKA
jgi:hypothetical protein